MVANFNMRWQPQTKLLSVGFAVKRKMAATSVVVLDRGNNTTCTVNLFGK